MSACELSIYTPDTTQHQGTYCIVAVVQLLSLVQLLATPWTVAPLSSTIPISSTIPWSLLKFMSFESVMPSNHLIFTTVCKNDGEISQTSNGL